MYIKHVIFLDLNLSVAVVVVVGVVVFAVKTTGPISTKLGTNFKHL